MPPDWCLVETRALRYRDAQRWMLDFCDDLNTDETIELLGIYEADESNPVPVMCPFQFFKTWCVCARILPRGAGGRGGFVSPLRGPCPSPMV